MFALPILICTLALAAACSHTSNTGVPTAGGSASPGAARGDYSTYFGCLRQHSINVPDPAPNSDNALREWERQQAEKNTAFDAAARACQNLMPAGPSGQQPNQVTPQQLEQYRTFAVCMRAHDIEMSDPDPNHPGNMQIGGRLANANRTQVEADPVYRAALDACKDKLPQEGANR
jgi:hypothetical protein